MHHVRAEGIWNDLSECCCCCKSSNSTTGKAEQDASGCDHCKILLGRHLEISPSSETRSPMNTH
jgi:hypothetical protein